MLIEILRQKFVGTEVFLKTQKKNIKSKRDKTYNLYHVTLISANDLYLHIHTHIVSNLPELQMRMHTCKL